MSNKANVVPLRALEPSSKCVKVYLGVGDFKTMFYNCFLWDGPSFAARYVRDLSMWVTCAGTDRAYLSVEPDLDAVSRDLRAALSQVLEDGCYCSGPSPRFSDIALQVT